MFPLKPEWSTKSDKIRAWDRKPLICLQRQRVFMNCSVQFSSVAQLCPALRDPVNCSTPGRPVHHQLPGVHSNSRPWSRWCHPAISSSVVPFFSCPQSLPASESFPMSQLFTWGGQSTGVSALASFLPKNTQDWSPSEWTGWISLQSKGLSRVFSNTTVQKHQFLGAFNKVLIIHLIKWLKAQKSSLLRCSSKINVP